MCWPSIRIGGGHCLSLFVTEHLWTTCLHLEWRWDEWSRCLTWEGYLAPLRFSSRRTTSVPSSRSDHIGRIGRRHRSVSLAEVAGWSTAWPCCGIYQLTPWMLPSCCWFGLCHWWNQRMFSHVSCFLYQIQVRAEYLQRTTIFGSRCNATLPIFKFVVSVCFRVICNHFDATGTDVFHPTGYAVPRRNLVCQKSLTGGFTGGFCVLAMVPCFWVTLCWPCVLHCPALSSWLEKHWLSHDG